MRFLGFGKKQKYSRKSILKQLDSCAQNFTFPMLDNGYIYPVTSRMTAYRDDERWALIIEVVGFNYRGGGHDGINNCLHVFGNCIVTEPGTDNSNFLNMTNDSEDFKTFDEEFEESLNPNAVTMVLRGQKVLINHSPEFYLNKGIELEDKSVIYIWEFLRGLVPKYDEVLLATDQELRERIPKNLPLVLALSEWNHPDCADSELPSENETFRQIAEVLETGNREFYKPTKDPNNHWKNWPEGGTL
ncbi:hypothetical protein JM84_2756 [Dokdonia sp. Hel_I_63]|uniref:DUF7003 family protein n=1 Tax=Dokdonia sp. Hel_I_63 TaxID=1249996 RepID=UPI00119944E7|nr:hypothetical protein [Dokdonia sp. Hel_I_63]TVZ23802.1 hypothetical protein JM84_2756 [Dokdonia sp. Hel_I_63]